MCVERMNVACLQPELLRTVQKAPFFFHTVGHRFWTVPIQMEAGMFGVVDKEIDSVFIATKADRCKVRTMSDTMLQS